MCLFRHCAVSHPLCNLGNLLHDRQHTQRIKHCQSFKPNLWFCTVTPMGSHPACPRTQSMRLSRTHLLAKPAPDKVQDASTHMGKIEAKSGVDSAWYKVIFSPELKRTFCPPFGYFAHALQNLILSANSFYPAPHAK